MKFRLNRAEDEGEEEEDEDAGEGPGMVAEEGVEEKESGDPEAGEEAEEGGVARKRLLAQENLVFALARGYLKADG